MKTGTDNRRMVGVLVVLALVAVFTTGRALLSGRDSQSTAAAAGSAKSAGTTEARLARVNRAFWKPRPLVSTLDPTLRFDLLKTSEDRELDSGKVNVFQGKVDIPVPVDPGTKKPGDEKPPVPQVVPPPPINLKFFGFASKPGEKKKIFLTSGDDVYIGSEGDIINRRYKIVKITNTGVEIEDILNNNKQTIPLTTG